MEEKNKPYVTISFRQSRHSLAILVIVLLIGVIVGAFGIQEFQRWQLKLLVTQARLHDTETVLITTENRLQETKTNLEAVETKLQDTEAALLEARKQLETYLPISPLNEPVAFISHSWGVNALTCTRTPQGYWTGWGSEDGIGRLLYYYAREWDSVEAINESGQYTLAGEDEWGAYWDEEEGFENQSYYTHVAVQELHPFTWSKSKDWYSNKESWEGRLTDYCREALQP